MGDRYFPDTHHSEDEHREFGRIEKILKAIPGFDLLLKQQKYSVQYHGIDHAVIPP
jgi:hypothetical protein